MNTDNGNYCLKVQPRYVVAYWQCLTRHVKPKYDEIFNLNSRDQTPAWKNNFANNSRKVNLSKTSVKKIKLAVDYMVYLAKPKKIYNFKTKTFFTFRLNFFTATLSSPQLHSDLVIKRDILQPFLDFIRKRYKVTKYVWRLEKQKNGSSHFHLILDKYIPWWILREKWNYYQECLGYISRYRENQLNWHANGFRYRPELHETWSLEKQRQAYIVGQANDWRNPNSTDIHSIQKIRDVGSYISKYITKDPASVTPGDICQGRIWAVSECLGNLNPDSLDWDSITGDEVNKLSNHKMCHTVNSDYFTVFYISCSLLGKIGCPVLYSMFQEWIKNKFPDE
jgi:hypothetical protein